MKTFLARTIAALAIFQLSPLAIAQFTLTPVVTTSTPVPGGTGNFKGFTTQDGADLIAPSLDGASFAFAGIDAAGRGGVYRWDAGVISLVANTSTPIPNRSATFNSFGFPAISSQQVAFRADSSGTNGVYVATGSQITTIADSSVTGIGGPSIANGQIAFAAGSERGSGIVRYRDGVLSVIASGYISVGGQPHVGRDGYVAFQEGPTDASLGIYLADNANVLSTVADSHTHMPGDSGNFTGLRNKWIASDGPDVAFGGYGPSKSGIFSRINGTLRSVMLSGQAAPNGQIFFDIFEPEISLDNKHLAFLTVSGTNINTATRSIFTDYRNQIERVIGQGDQLGGKVVEKLEMSPDALSGSSLVFTVRFTDASTAIYMTKVPEPSVLIAVFPVFLAMRRARRSYRFI